MIGATKGGFGYHGIEAAVVQIVVMIMVGANSVLTTKVIRENARKRFTEVAQAKAEAENLLERNEELDQQLSGNIADINVRFEKLTAASKTTTEAMRKYLQVLLIPQNMCRISWNRHMQFRIRWMKLQPLWKKSETA
mgnify:CR=1 FL=1